MEPRLPSLPPDCLEPDLLSGLTVALAMVPEAIAVACAEPGDPAHHFPVCAGAGGGGESMAQGVANVVTGLFGGMGGCPMIGRSMTGVNNGATGRLPRIAGDKLAWAS